MKVLILNQTFHPDVVATAQYASDLAVGLVEAGHEVTVISGSRGYDDTTLRLPWLEIWCGIRIFRVASTRFGKSKKWRRILDFGSFWCACSARLFRLPKFDIVLTLTSPPLISLAGALFARLKGGNSVTWVMDLNPDEAIAAHWLREGSIVAKMLRKAQIYGFRSAQKVIVLDRFMQERIINKGIPRDKIRVIPPWSHDDQVRYDVAGRAEFRAQHQLSDKFVVMYSGNHSPCHPLDTILEAAKRLASNPKVVFCFIGGGSEFVRVQQRANQEDLPNIRCLPYRPLEMLSASLSAADLQLIVMGDAFAGIIHPSKVYNILRIGATFLYIGPPMSHITEIAAQLPQGAVFMARHGDVDGVVGYILQSCTQSTTIERSAPSCVADHFSKVRLLPEMIQLLEEVSQGATS